MCFNNKNTQAVELILFLLVTIQWLKYDVRKMVSL